MSRIVDKENLAWLCQDRERLTEQIAALELRLAESQARTLEYESEIASVCPEDYSLAETIKVFRDRVKTLEDALELAEPYCCGAAANKAREALAAKESKA